MFPILMKYVFFNVLDLKENYKKQKLGGNVSIILASLPYQKFMTLIGTCGTGSVSLCCEGCLSPSRGT